MERAVLNLSFPSSGYHGNTRKEGSTHGNGNTEHKDANIDNKSSDIAACAVRVVAFRSGFHYFQRTKPATCSVKKFDLENLLRLVFFELFFKLRKKKQQPIYFREQITFRVDLFRDLCYEKKPHVCANRK